MAEPTFDLPDGVTAKKVLRALTKETCSDAGDWEFPLQSAPNRSPGAEHTGWTILWGYHPTLGYRYVAVEKVGKCVRMEVNWNNPYRKTS